MKIRRSFKFVFKSPGAFNKLLRGGLYTALFFTVFFAFVVLGYTMRVMCDLLEGRDTRLPEWAALKELFNDGLQPVLISLAFASPVIALSVLELYTTTRIIYAVQALLLAIISGIFPLALIHFVTARSFKAAFNLPVLLSFIFHNMRRVLSAWLIHLGLGLATLLIGSIVWLAMAVPLSLFTSVKTGAIVGFGIGAVVFLFVLFVTTIIIIHLYAQMYRASIPFEDDKEGAMRASIVMPPSLRK